MEATQAISALEGVIETQQATDLWTQAASSSTIADCFTALVACSADNQAKWEPRVVAVFTAMARALPIVASSSYVWSVNAEPAKIWRSSSHGKALIKSLIAVTKAWRQRSEALAVLGPLIIAAFASCCRYGGFPFALGPEIRSLIHSALEAIAKRREPQSLPPKVIAELAPAAAAAAIFCNNDSVKIVTPAIVTVIGRCLNDSADEAMRLHPDRLTRLAMMEGAAEVGCVVVRSHLLEILLDDDLEWPADARLAACSGHAHERLTRQYTQVGKFYQRAVCDARMIWSPAPWYPEPSDTDGNSSSSSSSSKCHCLLCGLISADYYSLQCTLPATTLSEMGMPLGPCPEPSSKRGLGYGGVPDEAEDMMMRLLDGMRRGTTGSAPDDGGVKRQTHRQPTLAVLLTRQLLRSAERESGPHAHVTRAQTLDALTGCLGKHDTMILVALAWSDRNYRDLGRKASRSEVVFTCISKPQHQLHLSLLKEVEYTGDEEHDTALGDPYQYELGDWAFDRPRGFMYMTFRTSLPETMMVFERAQHILLSDACASHLTSVCSVSERPRFNDPLTLTKVIVRATLAALATESGDALAIGAAARAKEPAPVVIDAATGEIGTANPPWTDPPDDSIVTAIYRSQGLAFALLPPQIFGGEAGYDGIATTAHYGQMCANARYLPPVSFGGMCSALAPSFDLLIVTLADAMHLSLEAATSSSSGGLLLLHDYIEHMSIWQQCIRLPVNAILNGLDPAYESPARYFERLQPAFTRLVSAYTRALTVVAGPHTLPGGGAFGWDDAFTASAVPSAEVAQRFALGSIAYKEMCPRCFHLEASGNTSAADCGRAVDMCVNRLVSCLEWCVRMLCNYDMTERRIQSCEGSGLPTEERVPVMAAVLTHTSAVRALAYGAVNTAAWLRRYRTATDRHPHLWLVATVWANDILDSYVAMFLALAAEGAVRSEESPDVMRLLDQLHAHAHHFVDLNLALLQAKAAETDGGTTTAMHRQSQHGSGPLFSVGLLASCSSAIDLFCTSWTEEEEGPSRLDHELFIHNMQYFRKEDVSDNVFSLSTEANASLLSALEQLRGGVSAFDVSPAPRPPALLDALLKVRRAHFASCSLAHAVFQRRVLQPAAEALYTLITSGMHHLSSLHAGGLTSRAALEGSEELFVTMKQQSTLVITCMSSLRSLLGGIAVDVLDRKRASGLLKRRALARVEVAWMDMLHASGVDLGRLAVTMLDVLTHKMHTEPLNNSLIFGASLLRETLRDHISSVAAVASQALSVLASYSRPAQAALAARFGGDLSEFFSVWTESMCTMAVARNYSMAFDPDCTSKKSCVLVQLLVPLMDVTQRLVEQVTSAAPEETSAPEVDDAVAALRRSRCRQIFTDVVTSCAVEGAARPLPAGSPRARGAQKGGPRHTACKQCFHASLTRWPCASLQRISRSRKHRCRLGKSRRSCMSIHLHVRTGYFFTLTASLAYVSRHPYTYT